MKLGIDCIDKYLNVFEGKRVGLITNPTGFSSDYRSTIDILKEKTNLVALFSNWDMYEDAINTSKNATGELQKQQDIYMDSTLYFNVSQLFSYYEKGKNKKIKLLKK